MPNLQLFGKDLFGDDAQPKPRGPVARKFLVPPFTILDARSGSWQERKRAWLRTGIKGEVGRDAASIHCPTQSDANGLSDASYTSIFDPMLCECMYRWFCPPEGQIVDPFAGGSVRGIVAAMLGMRYWGCDLRREQIDANETQAAEILPDDEGVAITVSGKMLRQKFHSCDAEYTSGVCNGRCCEGSDGISVIVHPSETKRIEALGATVQDGYMVADDRGLCPFKTSGGQCKHHGDKPMGCKASPFTFTDSGLLVVRNRYRLLRCYNCEGAEPAYVAHRWSLEQIFGAAEAERIGREAAEGSDRIAATMPSGIVKILTDNHNHRNGKALSFPTTAPMWICGDSMETLDAAPDADFVFSCPPYGDLEKYSDDPADLSNMEWHTFIANYRRIILRSVKRLKENRFACFVVGDFRDKKGFYRNFVSETIEAFRQCGAKLYNEAILVSSVGSASMRITKQFDSGRKMCKTHQNILVFCKGDWKKAANAITGNGS